MPFLLYLRPRRPPIKCPRAAGEKLQTESETIRIEDSGMQVHVAKINIGAFGWVHAVPPRVIPSTSTLLSLGSVILLTERVELSGNTKADR